MYEPIRITLLPESDWNPEEVRESMQRIGYEMAQGSEEERLRCYELFSRAERRACAEVAAAGNLFENTELSLADRARAARRQICWLLVLADLPFSPKVIRNFYLRRIVETSSAIEALGVLRSEDVGVRWKALADLGLLDHAQSLLDQPSTRNILAPDLLVFLEAELRYRRRHFLDIPGILAEYPKDTPLDARQRVRLFWDGGQE